MEALSQYNPYAFYGFTRELALTFKENRQSLIFMVNENKRLGDSPKP